MATEPSISKHSEPKPPAGDRGGNRRWRTVLRWGLVLLSLLLILNAVMWGWSRTAVRRAVETAVDNGASLEFRDHLPREVPDLENASHYLDAVAKLYHAFRHERVERDRVVAVDGEKGREQGLVGELTRVLHRLDSEQVPPGEEDLALFRSCVDRFGILYVILDEAAPLERARFRTHYSGALALEYEVPHLVARINVARLLSARAILAVNEGRGEDAYEDAILLFRYAGWVDQESPALISTSIAGAVARIGVITVNQLMLVATPEQGMADSLLAQEALLDPRTMFDRALLAERATNFSSLIDPDMEFTPYRPYDLLAAVHYCDAMTRAMEDSSPPAWQRAPDPEGEEYHRRYCSGLFSLPTKMMLVDCFNMSNQRDALQAYLDILGLALRIEEYRRENSGYPEGLDQLLGPLPVDPFSGESYRYRIEDDGYLMYSVGGNRVDDGGLYIMKPWKNRAGDLVWRIRP